MSRMNVGRIAKEMPRCAMSAPAATNPTRSTTNHCGSSTRASNSSVVASIANSSAGTNGIPAPTGGKNVHWGTIAAKAALRVKASDPPMPSRITQRSAASPPRSRASSKMATGAAMITAMRYSGAVGLEGFEVVVSPCARNGRASASATSWLPM